MNGTRVTFAQSFLVARMRALLHVRPCGGGGASLPARARPLFHIVLFRPEIPHNTGCIGRTCLATGCRLHLIHPLGFDVSDKAVARAGLDYWRHVDVREHASWEAYVDAAAPKRLWLFTTKGAQPHWQGAFEPGDHLVFGQETAGAPEWLHDWVDNRCGAGHRLCLPMLPDATRSLNLATSVAAATYEGVRQVVSAGT